MLISRFLLAEAATRADQAGKEDNRKQKHLAEANDLIKL